MALGIMEDPQVLVVLDEWLTTTSLARSLMILRGVVLEEPRLIQGAR